MQNGKAFGFKLTKASEYTSNINIPQSKKQNTIVQCENFQPLNIPLHLLFGFLQKSRFFGFFALLLL